ncbi:hypothetical protein EJ04DRAFT_547481 [Polyplosphaeria fusca]|uniref:Uncharacterized protein n=1 Tax=Polyplosphaeria fusca TaxID=682080 RepID=A0A9P4QL72_9PLEO|nr:hypothetical protein EJ04DRAFT_547481 [Polyplosphaeria fusca]
MATSPQASAYLLSYRSQNQDEDRRLDSQHGVITQVILGGNLIHPSIPLPDIRTFIADLARGTGIWLEDVRKTYFSENSAEGTVIPSLVGFDVNAHAFDSTLPFPIQLVQHDCSKEFPAEHIGPYAVPREAFSSLVSNAMKLLRPGGYLQWLETETRLFRQYPINADFTEAMATIGEERKSRGLVEK